MVKVKINVLKAIMKANNVNQKELARAIGIDPAIISKLLSKKRINVGAKFISGFLKYSGMQFDDLFFLSREYELYKSNILPGIISETPQVEVSNPRKKKSSSQSKSTILTGNKEVHENK